MNNIQEMGAMLPPRWGNGHGNGKSEEQLESLRGSAEQAGIDVSATGRMMSSMSHMGDGEREQMRDFRQQVRTAKRTGEFDAKELSEAAPDFLKTLAEENGVNLEQMVERMGRGEPGQARVPEEGLAGRTSAMSDYLSASSDEEKDKVTSLMDTLFGEEEEKEES